MNSRGADVWATPVGTRPKPPAAAAPGHWRRALLTSTALAVASPVVAGLPLAALVTALSATATMADGGVGGWGLPLGGAGGVNSATGQGGAGGGGSTSGFSGGGGGGERAQRAAGAAPATPAAASVAPAAPPQGLRVPPASIALPTVAPEVAAEVRTVSSAPRFRESPRAAAPVGKADPLSTTMTAARAAAVVVAPVATARS
jgi:hypothetical protein